MNAAKRLIDRLREDFPQLGLLIGGDALFSKQPIIEDILKSRMHYLFTAKPTDHKYMMAWLEPYEKLYAMSFQDQKGRENVYEWMNDVPLNGQKKSVNVDFLRCKISDKNKKEENEILYRNSWVRDWEISEKNIKIWVKAGHCRMKNHGYYMEKNYGHDKRSLAFNFYLLILLAFYFHQIFELTNNLYKACRKKLGSKKNLWGTIRSYIKIIIFETWGKFLEFLLTPTRHQPLPLGPPF